MINLTKQQEADLMTVANMKRGYAKAIAFGNLAKQWGQKWTIQQLSKKANYIKNSSVKVKTSDEVNTQGSIVSIGNLTVDRNSRTITGFSSSGKPVKVAMRGNKFVVTY